MELFASAGVDLPVAGSGGRRARPLVPTLHKPLFSARVLEDAARTGKVFSPTLEQRKAAIEYARRAASANFVRHKETAVRPEFIEQVLKRVLGWTGLDPDGDYTLSTEHPIGGGAVDVALGWFTGADKGGRVLAPFELKGPATVDLDRIDPGRRRSPVQQAWDYANDAPGCRWVLVSNCVEVRLYAYGRGRDTYQLFDLRKLDDADQHQRLWRLLGAETLSAGIADALLNETDQAYKSVTDALYKQYKELRGKLIGHLANAPEGPRLSFVQAIETGQKLLDRVLFIAFSQRTDLLPGGLLEGAAKVYNPYVPQPLWPNFQRLFQWVDKGDFDKGVPEYNGGLFASDEAADSVFIPDPLAAEMAKLGEWDYRREAPVTVLGRLFEQSVSDIEAMKAEARGQPAPKVGKKKREGVVYTPDDVTRFLVARTVGLSLDERRAALWAAYGLSDAVAADPATAVLFWRAYLEALSDFTIVDPACGSGAFLVAAFDELALRYRDAVSALEALGEAVDFDPYDRIVTRNLYGVDLNAESVEITRLSLWLKTARREHRLQNLEATIRDGNSLIEDIAYTPRPFDWRAAFPEVFARGGFDVVIGNPPYVRMELLKDVKPYLTERYAVADERTDLYAYFFERGVEVLKAGGRLGFISSSTFFRTGSGENLRALLGEGTALEAVVDYGDVQVFEGVTTYPAIVTLRKAATDGGSLRFLKVGARPEDLGRTFREDARPMPRARLNRGAWRLEGDALAALREKIAHGRPTLGEVYGAPLYGIKTGLNDAFVVSRATRDRLVERDPRSAELLRPFLRGEDIKRWRVESADLWLINTPKGRVDIDAYPAVRDHLSPFRTAAEKRATKQGWWELQQPQLAYQARLAEPKISYPHFQNTRMFAFEGSGSFSNDKSYFVPTGDHALLALLNSRLSWMVLTSLAPAVRDGWYEARVQYVERLPVPALNDAPRLAALATECGQAAAERVAIEREVRDRILELTAARRHSLPRALEGWPTMDFKQVQAAVKAALKADIPLKRAGEWQAYLADRGALHRRLTAAIAAAERDIDGAVYALFDLTPEEIALLEATAG